jgi:tetratricopeptide (TPR) repeat protein
MGAMFLLGEPFQKNLKAWRESLGLKPEPASKGSPAPEPLPPAPGAPIAGQTVSGNDNQSLQQTSAGGNLTMASGAAVVHAETIGGAQTVNNFYATTEPKRQRILSTIAPRPQRVGVMGREDELEDLDQRMGEPGNNRRLVVHGESGVGKSELLREYGRRHEARYPAGRYWIDCRLNLASELANLGRHCWQMAWLEGPLVEQALEVLQQLAKEKVLLLFDNASHEGQVEPFLPPAGQAHVLLSSTSRDWGPPLVEEWRPEGLQRLDPPTALAVLESVAGKAVAEQVGERVIAELGGLPVHLLPTARTLARKSRNGRLSEGQLVQLSNEGIDSFSFAWQALDPAARLLLQVAGRWFNPNALVEAELVAALAESFQGEAVVRNAVDACRDLYLLQGEGRLTMHQLLVRFVETQPPQRLAGIGAEELAPAVAAALGKAAKRLEQAPADGEALAALQCHQLGWDFWRQHPDGLSADICHHLGEALCVLGQFAEASHWFEAAAALIRREAELDHLALGDNLHEIGICAYEQGQWTAAAGWFEQALAEKRQGDLQEAVNHQSIGASLHGIGLCLMQQEKYLIAVNWLEQAVEEKRQGDLNRRVDHESLGTSLHTLGICALEQGEFDQAVGWLKKALTETCQGNSYGNIDHLGLGMSLHEIGSCSFLQEKWDEAISFYEKAIAEKRLGDLDGRVNHREIGTSLHQIGNCFYQKRDWAQASKWFEQATNEIRLGNVHEKVDHHHLGKSLYELGNCAKQLGQLNAAEHWFKQAVAEMSHSDIFGRVDENSVAEAEESLDLCREKLGLT